MAILAWTQQLRSEVSSQIQASVTPLASQLSSIMSCIDKLEQPTALCSASAPAAAWHPAKAPVKPGDSSLPLGYPIFDCGELPCIDDDDCFSVATTRLLQISILLSKMLISHWILKL